MSNDEKKPELIGLLKKSLFEIKKLKLKQAQSEEPIAVIGMACRFPGGANSPEAYWEMLKTGRDGISEVPADRFDIDYYYDPDPNAAGKINTRKGGFLDLSIRDFDAEFFGITPREAQHLDPQQRLLLEITWEALERAGIAISCLENTKTSVYVGLAATEYLSLLEKNIGEEDIDAYFATGNAGSTATGRLSFLLGLQGPNAAVNTACSSSLVALDLGCESLRNGSAEIALVGGVNVMLMPDMFISFSKGGMLSSDGYCKTFDKRADGYSRGEGCGMVVLKRLPDAKKDHDRILAVIRATGVNQDGASSGLTVPNGESQVKLIRSVMAKARVSSSDIDMIEAHGTGTALGDPIEVRAIGATYGKHRDKSHPLILNSVKANIGHLEAAAGIAGLIKVILTLQHQMIPTQPCVSHKEHQSLANQSLHHVHNKRTALLLMLTNPFRDQYQS